MAWNEVANLRGPGMVYKGNYSASTSYNIGDVVYYDYATWIAKVPTTGVAPNTSGAGAASWGLVAARGAQGQAGESAPKYYGVLRWSGPWYNPPANIFTRLRTYSDGRLVVHKDSGGVANASGSDPYLYIPVSGMWQISATQTWGNAAVAKGCGLGRSSSSATSGVELWEDFNGFNHGVTSRATFLEAGTTLYPWTWNGTNSGMSPADRDLSSEYSAVLLHLA